MHFATKIKSPGMKKFIYRVREDGLYLLDLKTIDARIASQRTLPSMNRATWSYRIKNLCHSPAQKFARDDRCQVHQRKSSSRRIHKP